MDTNKHSCILCEPALLLQHNCNVALMASYVSVCTHMPTHGSVYRRSSADVPIHVLVFWHSCADVPIHVLVFWHSCADVPIPVLVFWRSCADCLDANVFMVEAAAEGAHAYT